MWKLVHLYSALSRARVLAYRKLLHPQTTWNPMFSSGSIVTWHYFPDETAMMEYPKTWEPTCLLDSRDTNQMLTVK